MIGSSSKRMVLGLSLGVGLSSCDSTMFNEKLDGFSDMEWTAIREIEPLATPPKPNPSNKYWNSDAAAQLGQMIFMDTAFSTAVKVDGPSGKTGETGKVACVTCHDPNKFWIDSRTTEGLSHGVAYTARNSPTLLNIAWYDWVTWAGKHDSLSMQGANAPEAGTDVATSRLLMAHVLYKKYRDEYAAVFGTPLDPALDPMHPEAARFPPAGRPKAMGAEDGPWEKMAPADRDHVMTIMANVGKAIEAFERKLESRNSPFERYVKGDHAALTDQQKNGLRLFIGKASCNECHRGPILSDNAFHNIGVPQAVGMAPATDKGRLGDIPIVLSNPFNAVGKFSDDPDAGRVKHATVDPNDQRTLGAFRTPGLLSIEGTGPYFHNGSVKTLEEVVHFYNVGGGAPGTFMGEKDPKIRPLGLTTSEEHDLVAFLRSLTGAPVPAAWAQNTAKP